MTTKLAHDNSETSTLSNSDWISTSLTSSTLHNCPSFSSLCSQRFHTNHNAVDLQVPRVDQRTAKKKKRKKKTSDRHHIDKKAACCGNQLQRSARFDTRYAEPPRALVTMFAIQTSGMHCACVHTKCRHALRMRSHELESDARFCCKSPPPPLSLSLSLHKLEILKWLGLDLLQSAVRFLKRCTSGSACS